MVHPSTEVRFISDTIGYGLVATALIPKGTIIWALCELDRKFEPDEAARLPSTVRASFDKYSYVDRDGRYVLVWDNARYVNHSCEATCLPIGHDIEIAVRDIQPGEQLTDDYGGLNVQDFDCRCGSPKCRGTVRATDILDYGADWDAKVRDAYEALQSVPQPLWDLVRDRPEIRKIAEGSGSDFSCVAVYCARGESFRAAM